MTFKEKTKNKSKKQIASILLAATMAFTGIASSFSQIYADEPATKIMVHPTEDGDIKMAKEYKKIGDDLYRVKVRLETKYDPTPQKVNELPKTNDVDQITVLSIDTSSSFSDVSSNAKSALKEFSNKIFDLGDYTKIAMLGTNGETFSELVGNDKRKELESAINRAGASGGHGIADYDKAFRMLNEYEKSSSKPVKKRIISLFDGDNYDDWDKVMKQAKDENVDLYAIFFGSNNKENVKKGASKPEYFFDSTLDSIDEAYKKIVQQIKSEIRVIPKFNFEDAVADLSLDYGFDLVKDSVKTKDGSAEALHNSAGDYGSIRWDIGDMSRTLPNDSKIRVAEIEYDMKLNRDLANHKDVTQVYPKMTLTYGKGKDRKTTQFSENSSNFLGQIVDLETIIKEKDKLIAELNDKINKLIEENKVLNKKIENLTNELNKEKQDNAALRQNVKDLQEQLAENRKFLEDYKERVIKVTAELEKYKTKYGDEVQKNKELNGQLIKAQSTIERLKEIIDNLTKENINLQNQIKTLTDENNKLKTDLTNAYKDIAVKNETIKQLNLKNTELQVENAKKETEIRDLQARNTELKVDLGRKEEEIISLNKEIVSLNQTIGEKNALIAKKEEQIRNLQDENKHLNMTLVKKNQKIKRLKKDIKRLKEEINQKNIELTKKEATINQLKDTVANQKATIAKQEQKIKDLKTENKELKETINRNNIQITKLQGEVEKLKMEVGYLKGKIDLMQEIINNLEEKNRQLIKENEDLKTQVERLKNKIKELTVENAELQYKLNKKDKEIKSLKEKLMEALNLIEKLSPIRTTQRYEGRNRTLTSVAISKTFDHADSVLIARNEADALSASMLARSLKAPILIAPSESSLGIDIEGELHRLQPKDVYIIGGELSLNKDIMKYLDTRFNTKRISGHNRSETSLNIAKIVREKEKTKDTILTNGYTPDSLIASGYNKIVPIVLTDKKDISKEVLKELQDNNQGSLTLVGGESSLNENITKKIPAYVRVAGHDRYETAVNFANQFYNNVDEMILASGDNTIDAVSATGLLKDKEMPILLTKKSSLSKEAKEFINDNKIKHINIVGGSESVSNLADKTLEYKLD